MLIASTESGGRLKENLSDIKESDILFSVMVSTSRLKKLCKERHLRKGVKGGDDNTSLGVLIKSKDLL